MKNRAEFAQVSFSITKKDYRRFSTFVNRRSFIVVPTPGIFIAILTVFTGAVLLMDEPLEAFVHIVLPLYVFVGAYLLLAKPLILGWHFSRLEHLHGEHTLKLAPEGFTLQSTSAGESFTPWEAVREVIWDKSNIYFFLGRRAAIIVPKRCFSPEAESDNFLGKAQDLLEHAKTR